MVLLTKSKFLNGLQCPKLLWRVNQKSLPEITLSDEHKFAQGHEFEKYVKLLYPDGVELGDLDFNENIEATTKAVEDRKLIFEAGFQVGELFVRSDLLEPVDGGWNLYEIKSSSEVKDVHFPDLAFQKFVLEKAGLTIKKCFVIYINKEYQKNGEINPSELVAKEEVTEKVELIEDLEDNSQKYLEIIKRDTVPEHIISQKCNKPYPCPLKNECWGELPKYNVLQLTNWRVYWKLFAEGVEDIKNIPDGTKLTPKDEVEKEAVEQNKPYISKEHIKHFLNTLKYPLYHFDFETIDTAVPIFDKSKPYQKIAFQYSLHIEQEDGSTEHREFLAEGSDDPRPALLEQLKNDLQGEGSIVVYNQSFEISVLNKLAEDFPEHKEWINAALGRIVDLATPFKAFHYYNPEQKGSYSIKKVLPAVTGKSYSELEINNGGDASMLFFYSHIKPKLENKEEIRANLYKYCGLDTEGMVWIIQELKKMI
jgi:hypothetical protein